MELQDLQQQIDALTERLTEVENRPQIPGPQGKPGNIDAALHNMTAALKKVTDEHAEYVRGRIAEQDDRVRRVETKLQDAVQEFSRAVVDAKRGFLDSIDGSLDSKVLEIMKAYRLLGEDNGPTLAYLAYQVRDVVDARLKELGVKS